jgi:thioredoxin reductase
VTDDVDGAGYDVVIAGGGPAGLSAALALGRARRRVLVVDSGRGRNSPADAVHGYLTQDGTSPARVREIAHGELSAYPSIRIAEGTVKDIAPGFTLTLENREVSARRVLVATGVVDDLPGIDGLGELWGRGVFHCPYCHGYEVRDEPIAVLAVEPDDVSLAAKVACYSGSVVLCTGGRITLGEDRAALLDRLGVRIRTEPIARLEAEDERLRRIVFEAGPAAEATALFVHGVTRQASDLAERLGCELLDDGSVAVDDMQLTSVPGVYAAGDLARRPSMPLPGSMVSLAVAAGTVAGVAIDQDLLREDLG